MKTYKTSTGSISIDFETYDGNPVISVIDNGDAATDEKEVSLHLDNYQAYELAISILRGVDVIDTRGSS